MALSDVEPLVAIRVVFLFSLLVDALGITIVLINRFNLFDTTRVCYDRGFFTTRCVTTSWNCFLSTSDDPNPCQYTYAVGVVAVIMQVFVIIAVRSFQLRGAACSLISVLLAMAWWIAAAVYLTNQNKVCDRASVPKGNYRDGVIGVAWAAVALTALQGVLVCLIMKTWGKRPLHHADQQMTGLGPQYGYQGPPGGQPQGYPGYPGAGGYGGPGAYPPQPPPGYPQQYPPPGAPGVYPPPAGYQPPPGYPPAGYPGNPNAPATGYPVRQAES